MLVYKVFMYFEREQTTTACQSTALTKRQDVCMHRMIDVTHIKICIVGCNLVQFGWVKDTHNNDVTTQQPSQVTLCCNLLAPVRRLSFNGHSTQMSFSQVQLNVRRRTLQWHLVLT